MENIFAQATQLKLRFYHNGVITVEDLWDLSDNELHTIYVEIYQSLSSSEVGLLKSITKEERLNQLRLDIIKYIFDMKQLEEKARLEQANNSVKKQQILGIIAQRQNEEYQDMSLDDLKEMVSKL